MSTPWIFFGVTGQAGGGPTTPRPKPPTPPVVIPHDQPPPIVIPPAVGGGFLSCDDTSVRKLDPIREPVGVPFRFPAPWNTRAVVVASDPALEYVGYSYWRNLSLVGDKLHVFLGLNRNRGGAGPTRFVLDAASLRLLSAEPIFSTDHPASWATGEGWYFSAVESGVLYRHDGPRFLRGDKEIFRLPEGQYLWQMSSDGRERVHAGTVRDLASYEMLGAVVYDEDTGKQTFYPKKGAFDECQIDKSGRWLVVKEDDDNRIIDLERSTEKVIQNAQGAVGHSDTGRGFVIGEDDMDGRPNALRQWNLEILSTQLNVLSSQLMYYAPQWDTGMGHVSLTNVLNPSFCLLSQGSAHLDVPRNNELLQVPLDGSCRFRPIAPVMTELERGDPYRNRPKANLDATGRWAIYTTNLFSDQLSAIVVEVPPL